MGYDIEEVVGQHHSIFVQPDYKESSEYKEFWQELKSGQFIQSEFQRLGKNGKNVWIQGSYNPIYGRDNKPYKILKIALDITPQKEFMNQLNKQNEKLEAQEEELRVSNDELKEQASILKKSEEKIETSTR